MKSVCLLSASLALGVALLRADPVFAEDVSADASESAPESEGETARLREELESLRERLAELLRRNEELARRLGTTQGLVRAAVEDYLEARGVTGLALADRELRPLDRVLMRATHGAELRLRYERWDDLVDLDSAPPDAVDFSEARARLAFGYALVEGPELEFEIEGVLRQGGLLDLSPLFLMPPLPAWQGADPVLLLGGPGGEAEFAFRRAQVSLPAFNLFGRLLHVPVVLVAGRQEIALGDGFLLGRDDDGEGITWDGARLFWESGDDDRDRVDVFLGRAAGGAHAVASRIDGPVDPESDPAIEVAGVCAETEGLLPDTRFAAYLVAAQAAGITSATPGYVDLPTVEVNTLGVEADLDLTWRAKLRLDGALQWGKYGAQDIEGACAAAAELEFAAPEEGGVGFSVYAAYGSGDRWTPGEYEGFIPLAQDARGRWDEAGLLSSRNTSAFGARVSWTSARGVEAGLRFTSARAPQEESAAGLLLADAAAGSGNDMGSVLSVFAEWPLYEQEGSRLRVVYTRFDPGDYFASSADPGGQLRLEMRFGF